MDTQHIVTNKPELSIWITPNPSDKHSGTWSFYNDIESYEDDLALFKKKHKGLQMTLKGLMKAMRSKGETTDE